MPIEVPICLWPFETMAGRWSGHACLQLRLVSLRFWGLLQQVFLIKKDIVANLNGNFCRMYDKYETALESTAIGIPKRGPLK